MKNIFSIFAMLFLLIHGFLSPNVSSEKESLEDFITKVDYPHLEYSLKETYQEGNGSYLPIEFVPNRGQLSDKDVKFQVNDRNGAVFFKPGELHLAIYDQPNSLEGNDQKKPDQRKPPYELRIKYRDANKDAAIVGGTPLPGKANFLLGQDSEAWITDVETYRSVVYQDLYPGIHLNIEATNTGIKSSYQVAAGADPAVIHWTYGGAKEVSLEPDGSLLITIQRLDEVGPIRETAPIAWQMSDGQRVDVPVTYTVQENKEVSFSFPSGFNPNSELIIDPTIDWGTYIGNAGADENTKFTRDTDGNLIVTGFSTCSSYPILDPTFGPRGSYDIILSKLNPEGTQLLYSTCIGGSLNDLGNDLVTDGDNNIIVVGETDSANFPIVSGIPTHAGTICDADCEDIFVLKLNSEGNQILYSTYLGGNYEDKAYGVTVDNTGKIYLVGVTHSADFPVTANAFDTTFNDAAGCTDVTCKGDIAVVKIDPSLSGTSALLYSTFIGSVGEDYGMGIHLDNDGKVYVIGFGGSSVSGKGLPMVNALQSSYLGSGDVYIAKLDFTLAGNASLLFGTHLGGSGTDRGYAITADNAGNAYVTGLTTSSNFPVANAYQGASAGGEEAFVAKLQTIAPTQLIYSTYLGGTSNDSGYDIAIDNGGRAYLTGYTSSANFPSLNPLWSYSAGRDAFLTVLSTDGASLVFSTPMGGSLEDVGRSILLDPGNNIYVSGSSKSSNFPTTAGAYNIVNTDGKFDVFVVKIEPVAPPHEDPLLIWSAEGSANSWFGFSVGTAGDLNGDGYKDLIVGAPNYSNNETEEGAVYVYYYHQEIGNYPTTPDLILESNESGAHFGWSVGSAGNVDGLFGDDIIVGAVGCSRPEPAEGCAFVYLSSASGLSQAPAWVEEGNQNHAAFGYVVGSAGDINNDGKSDVFVSAPNFDAGHVDEGKVFVYYGTSDGVSLVEDWAAEGDQAYAYFGMAVASAGDTNGDGIADLLVGAPNARETLAGEGKAFVFTSSPSGLSATASWVATGGQEQAHFGEAVSSAGDINGDGKSEVMVGAPDYDGSLMDEGQVSVFFSSDSGLSVTSNWTSLGGQENAGFGVSVTFAGDIYGDGYADLLIGTNRFSDVETNEGKGFLYSVTSNGVELTVAWADEGNQAFANYSYSIGPAVGVMGNGTNGFLIGAPQFDQGQNDTGQVTLYAIP